MEKIEYGKIPATILHRFTGKTEREKANEMIS